MTARQTWYRGFPRNGWGVCRECGRSALTFYVNAQYMVDRESGRQTSSELLCRPCIDRWLQALAARQPLS